jgi:hypothetical protein
MDWLVEAGMDRRGSVGLGYAKIGKAGVAWPDADTSGEVRQGR